MKSKKIFFTSVFLLFVSICISQNFTIKGTIANENNEPLEFVEVYLQHPSEEIQEVLSDNLGYFEFQINEAGNYILIISYLGETNLKKELSLSENLDLGTISIQSATNLDNILIKTQRKQMERKVDRLVFNVTNSIQSVGSDAFELLKITPRIKVQNDEISMIGKSKMLVMVNDKMVQLSGIDLVSFLRSLPSDDIESIEVITNPPSKYSAEGNSGILNIVTKKRKTNDWNVALRSSYRQAIRPSGTVGATLNYKKEKLTFSINTNYNKAQKNPLDQNTMDFEKLFWKETHQRKDFLNTFSSGLALDYEISDKITTGINYKYNTDDFELRDKTTSLLINKNTQASDSLIKTPSVQFDKKALNTFNYHLVYKIDSLKRKLTFDFDYFNYDSKSNRTFNSNTFLATDLVNPISFFAGNTQGSQKIENNSFNLDMEHPTNWANFNYGARISKITTQSGFDYYHIINEEKTLDPAQSNFFNYKENTQAIYFSIDKKWSDKWQTKIGLRYENTQTLGNSITLNEKQKRDYSKLFPTAYLTYEPNDDNSFSLSYSRRINRPNYYFLNPFRWVSSAYSYSEGNPYLQPAFTNNLEFEYVLKQNFITSIYYSHTDDDFEYLTIVNPETKVQRNIPQNFIINKTFGINQTVIIKPFKWVNINLFGTVYYSSTDSKVPVTLQYLKAWNGAFSIHADFTLNESKTLFFNTNFSYITPGVDNLDRNSEYNQLNLGFKGLFLDKKLVVSLYGNDVTSASRITYSGFSNGVETKFRNYYDSQFFTISVNYSFGKAFDRQNRNVKNDEDLDRIN